MTTTLASYANFESFESKKLDVFIQLGKDLDEDVLSEMLYTYFQTTDETVASFKTYFASNDHKAIAHLAHKLKSSSGQLGLNKLHRLCTDLESVIKAPSGPPSEPEIKDFLTLIYDEIHLTTALLNIFLRAA